MSRTQKPKPKSEAVETDAPTQAKTKDAVDVMDLIDEIDSVLEENAEVFVRDFTQKGGE